MATGLDEFIEEPSTEELHVMSVEYEEQYGEPVVYLFCRTRDREFRWVEVVDHRPSFFIEADSFDHRVKNHEWVTGWDQDVREGLHEEELVRIYTQLPKHVGGGRDIGKPLREYFENTWEADVWYANRFLIDTDIYTHIEVPLSEAWTGTSVSGDYRVPVDDIEAVEDPDWRVEPRVITADIEVASPDGFPDATEARQPVTAITAHDNYSDEYAVWVLRHESWVYSDAEVRNMAIDMRPSNDMAIEDVSVFENESAMLESFSRYVEEKRPDMLAGWNSSTYQEGDAFDYPYLINRSKNLNNISHRDWSPMGQVWQGRGGRYKNVTANAKGVIFFDLMEGYQKTQYQKPHGGWSLDNISRKELDIDEQKLDVEDIDALWEGEPGKFLQYNMRDVEATVGIADAVGVIELYQNIRRLTGAQFDNLHTAYDTIDLFCLRQAREYGIALPTNDEPDADWYWGAYVPEPKIGLHEWTTYPDLWSMYPNRMRACNMSPETIVGTEEDLAESPYTEEDCRWSYIDTRPENVKEPADEPEMERVFFLKPSIKEGFVASVVDDLMDLKDYYSGHPLYGPVKHNLINAIYGVFGDKDSYGKGFRLFDWRMAEGITLGGQKQLKYTIEQYIEAVNDIKAEQGLEGNNAYLVGGDTDSVMTSIPFAESLEQAVSIAQEAASRVNETYPEWSRATFNVENDDHHYCEVEIESVSLRTFVPEGKTKKKAKKRYAELIGWDEDDGFLDEPEFEVTGIDTVRSDRAEATHDVVEKVLRAILYNEDREKARQEAYDIISGIVEDIEAGERPPSYIARPRGMTKPPHQYGSADETPMPTYRGAKYANQNFAWEDMGPGSQPNLLYIENVRGDWPQTYTAETKEDGADVDAVALSEPDRLPSGFVIDTDKMIEKVLEDPLTPILGAMRWSFEDAISDTEQAGIEHFM